MATRRQFLKFLGASVGVAVVGKAAQLPQSISADVRFLSGGFQAGAYNVDLAEYGWMAGAGSDYAAGTYYGDGDDRRDVIIGFEPEWVIVKQL